eukprot:TRINITY_DN28027_c0_g1_i1.p1 TRINITY_DN28027_c0_g1~~TRINITY_DN28027_c0_g1_i1.p1  ORF type:complete len:342 (-),score=45.67 TRINITY_DN28027_c0_g1_i1:96-1121(-)
MAFTLQALKTKAQKSIQRVVSGNRSRLIDGDIDIDFTYILDNVAAMGFPAEGLEGIYRNDLNEVAQFLTTRHAGTARVWNLSGRSYDYSKLGDIVIERGFPDHHPPPLGLLLQVVREMHEWVSASEANVAVVHCLAGKGRTGTVIAAYLMYTCQCSTAEEALTFFKDKRNEGVEAVGQARYLHYFQLCRKAPLSTYLPPDKTFRLSKLELLGVPNLEANTISLSIMTYNFELTPGKEGSGAIVNRVLLTSTDYCYQARASVCGGTLTIPCDLIVAGDLLVNCFHRSLPGLSNGLLFRTNFHTHFINEESQFFSLKKSELDVAEKNPHLLPDFEFRLTLTVE